MSESKQVLIFATSLSPTSRSFILAQAAQENLNAKGVANKLIDLREYELPESGRAASGDSDVVKEFRQEVAKASHILFACAIYNYDVSSAAKNLVELLTNDEIVGKTIGFLCAAGGRNSYMSVMPFANSLMLDFRCWIVPRFVYAVKNDFSDSGTDTVPANPEIVSPEIVNPEIKDRISLLVDEMLQGSA